MSKENQINPNFRVKDYSVSGESFQLIHNKEWDYLETVPKPELDKLAAYYKSDDYISHTDTSRNLFEKVYQLIRSLSLKRKLKLINEALDHDPNSFSASEKKLLDFGCGTGDFLKVAQANGWDVTGIEPNQKARNLANNKCADAAFDTEYLNDLPPNEFDVITLWHVLEHLPDLQNQLHTLERLLTQNGTLVIAVPNYKSKDAKHYKKCWAAYDVPRHLYHFSQKAISKLAVAHKMKVIKTKPMIFDAFYVSLLSEKHKSGHMNPVKALWNGLRSNWSAKQSGEYSSLIYILKKANDSK